MDNENENTYNFIYALQKMLELYDKTGENKVPIEDIRLLLRHFEINIPMDG